MADERASRTEIVGFFVFLGGALLLLADFGELTQRIVGNLRFDAFGQHWMIAIDQAWCGVGLVLLGLLIVLLGRLMRSVRSRIGLYRRVA
ncbi:hypothetical protein JNW90_14955 [Micromonospora sp. STR1s_5]|nr:hypothetical protein [Micromonospora sp. STR1s_5]